MDSELRSHLLIRVDVVCRLSVDDSISGADDNTKNIVDQFVVAINVHGELAILLVE